MRPVDWIDLPPVWLGLCLAIVWGFDRVMPWGLFGPMGQSVGAGLAILGVAIMLGAAAQMLAARTTVIPRKAPAALVTGGFFWLVAQSDLSGGRADPCGGDPVVGCAGGGAFGLWLHGLDPAPIHSG